MSRLYARAIVLLRYLMAPAWIGLTVLVLVVLPPLQSTSSRSGFSAILSPKSPAVRAQVEALHQFGFPLLAELAIVQHDPHGLPAATQANTVRRAVQLDLHQLHGFDDIAGAIPITNTLRLFPSARQRGTTAITYLFFRPSVGLGRQIDLTHAYSKAYLSGPGSGLIGATGPFLAQDEQGTQISNSLSAVELAVILLVLVVVGLVYRSVLAPLVTLVAAGCAYFVSERALALATVHLGITVPGELHPVIVVLLLGIMTDYSVFFLSAFRTRLGEGEPPRRAMVRAATDVVPLVLTAGITVAAGVAVLGAARLPLFAQLGPGLAITVAIGVLVALTFVPATLALLGALAYWPGSTWRRHRRRYRRDP
ncbi:MAG: MMPL family transporter, partial [Acidimicrobiales bacterium]